MANSGDNKTRSFSSLVVDSMERAPSRAMLHAVGFNNEDFKKPQIGIASTWSMVTPCNMHINNLADNAAKGVDDANGKAVVFNTITISDGISMGTEGMKYSLVSREVIADSIETVVGCQGFDGVVAIGGCDKNMPGCMIALSRLNRPSIFVYGGTILPGCHKEKKLVFARFSSGDEVGEISIVTEKPHAATVIATSPVRLLMINTQSIQAWRNRYSDFNHALRNRVQIKLQHSLAALRQNE